jgi:phosphoserine phosphatase RsbU/P
LSSDRPSHSQQSPPGGIFASLKFNTKFLLVTGISVILGALLQVMVSRTGLQQLSDRSRSEIEQGLTAATKEYLTNHISDKVKYTDYQLGHAEKDLEMLTAIVQNLIDHDQELEPILREAAQSPLLKDKLVYNDKSNWYQNKDDEPAAVAAWGYLGDKGALKLDTQAQIDRTAILDLIMPLVAKNGANKLQIYYVGPHEIPFARMYPYVDIGGYLDKMAPGHNDQNWYDFFYPGLHDGWKKVLADPDVLKKGQSLITVIPPYEDAAGGGLVMTLFHPLWTKDRKGFTGSIGFDIALAKIVESIKDVKLAETGYAFLAQSDGNVLAINDAGAKSLGLQGGAEKGGGGLAMLKRVLKDSKESEIKNLKLPDSTTVDYHEISLDGRQHIIVLQRLRTLSSVVNAAIVPDHWTLGFVVPKDELYRSLDRSQVAIEQTRTSLTKSQGLITIGSLVIVMLGVYLVSRRMTGALVALSEGASRMRQGDYGVAVEVSSGDEIGQLTVAFNEMAAEIQAHTANLEGLVKDRTKDLEEANKEIMSLNSQLAQENLRLGAELNVARQLQLMVLPAAQELKEIKDLDIAGYMAPADEVGGDYYDVLRGNGVIKIGIGDVTGHGLESGVLMLMVQTAVRTLLASNETDPQRFLGIVNKVIYQNIQRISSDKNLTLSLMDYSDGKLRLTGQHEEVIIVRVSGELERVDTTSLGLPVGMDEDITEFLSNTEIDLASGDVVVLFTDGVTEAERVDTAQYGVERLCEIVTENHSKTSQEIKDAIIDDVMAHIGTNKVYDDITVLVIKRL